MVSKGAMDTFKILEEQADKVYEHIIALVQRDLETRKILEGDTPREVTKKLMDSLTKMKATRYVYLMLKEKNKNNQEKTLKLIDEWHEYTFVLEKLFGENNYWSQLDWQVRSKEQEAIIQEMHDAENIAEAIEKKFQNYD